MLLALGRLIWVLVCGAFLAIIFFWVAVDLYLFMRLQALWSFVESGIVSGEGSISVRLALIRYAATAWLDSPIFGHGVRAFEKESGFGIYAHNNYLELLYDFGFVGFLFFYLPLAVAFVAALVDLRRSRVNRGWSALLLGLLVFWFVQDFFIVSYFRYSTWSLFLLMIFAWRKMDAQRLAAPYSRSFGDSRGTSIRKDHCSQPVCRYPTSNWSD
jgi:O-antigen ligase